MQENLDISKITNSEYEDLIAKSFDLKNSKEKSIVNGKIIAIENKPFSKSYKSVNKPKALAELVINSAINELENAGLIRERLENLRAENVYEEIKEKLKLIN